MCVCVCVQEEAGESKVRERRERVSAWVSLAFHLFDMVVGVA